MVCGPKWVWKGVVQKLLDSLESNWKMLVPSPILPREDAPTYCSM
jgi:hypothetical protein